MKYIDSILYAHRRSTIKLLIIFSHLATVSTRRIMLFGCFRPIFLLFFLPLPVTLSFLFRITLTSMGREEEKKLGWMARSFSRSYRDLDFFPVGQPLLCYSGISRPFKYVEPRRWRRWRVKRGRKSPATKAGGRRKRVRGEINLAYRTVFVRIDKSRFSLRHANAASTIQPDSPFI